MNAVAQTRKILRIIAPSGAMETPDLLLRAAQRLGKLGFEVQLDPQCHLIEQRFAGRDIDRALALNNALFDPKVHVVMAARGGYGAHRLLPLLNWKKLAKAVVEQGKQVVGHSDFTAIQLALLRHGAPSYAGSCAGVDFGGEKMNAFMKNAFAETMENGLNVTVKAKQAGFSNSSPFEAEGMFWGGNLAMLCSLLGTPYFPKPAQIAGGILFVEDTNERPFRVERMMNQLHLAGVLDAQQAIVWGDFGKPVAAPIDRGYGLQSVLDYMHSQLRIPIVTGLPFGHTPKKLTMPIGKQVQLTTTAIGFTLKQID